MTSTTYIPGSDLPSPLYQGEQASLDHHGVPYYCSPDKDLVAKPYAQQDSWFLVSYLESDRGLLPMLTHYMLLAPQFPGFVQGLISLLDPETNTYIQEEQDFAPDECTLDQQQFNVATPIGGMSGTFDGGIHTTGTWGEIQVDLTCRREGPMLLQQGTGIMPILGGTAYEYSFVNMPTTGTVTIRGTTYQITDGRSWLDRQWGVTPRFFYDEGKKWIWFGIVLDDGSALSTWDLTEPGGRHHSWGTLMHPSGLHEIFEIEPQEELASGVWTSSATGNNYPTKWELRIPQLDATISIDAIIPEQEIVSKIGAHKYEGQGLVTGTMRGKDLNGRATMELVGNGWHGPSIARV